MDDDLVRRLRVRAEIRRKTTCRGPEDKLANVLDDAADEVEKLHGCLESIHDALTADLEHGVAWLNDEASAEFAKKYPNLLEALNKAMKEM